MELGSRLRFYRIQKNMTQEELAKNIISVSYLSKIENNQTTASIEVLELLCNRLGIKLIEEEEFTVLKELNDWYYNIVQRNMDIAKSYYEQKVNNIYNSNDARVPIWFVLFELQYFLMLKDLERAEEQIKKINLFNDIFDMKMNYYYHKFVAYYHYLQKRYLTSIQHYKQSEQLYSSSMHFENWEKADLYYYIGLVYSRNGNLALSLVYTQNALSIYQSLYDLKRSAECQILIGISYERIEEFKLAEESYLLAKKVSEGINDTRLLGIIHHNLGMLYSKQHMYRESISEFEKSIHFKADSNIYGKLRSIHSIIEEYRILDDREKIKGWLEVGKEILSKYHEGILEFELHFTYFELLLNEDFDELEIHVKERVIPYFESSENSIQVMRYAEALAKYYQDKHKYKYASFYLELVIKHLKKNSYIY